MDKSKEENIRGHHDMEKDNNLCRFVAKVTPEHISADALGCL